jgi:site-specific DNA-methyltransferase (adenine-specific)
MSFTIHHGDCREVMATLDAESVDAIVCDPPYGLEFMGKDWDSFGGQHGWKTGAGFSKPGIGDRQTAWPSFTGASDQFGGANPTCASCGGRARGKKKCSCEVPDWRVKGEKPDRAYGRQRQMLAFQEAMESVFLEALRVAKPGAHLLAFGGTRTYHRLACAIEDAGWEIRDCVMWVYGSGFPKSHDVSKAIDKAAGAERGRKTVRSKSVSTCYAQDDWTRQYGGTRLDADPITDDARQWQGWGTALKPAWEPIIVARKPLVGTVAENVLTHGTGAINVDGCRVAGGPSPSAAMRASGRVPSSCKPGECGDTIQNRITPERWKEQRPGEQLGRWPANLIHDGSEEVVGLFPVTTSGALNRASITAENGIYGNAPKERTGVYAADSGSAARFFYCAKASKADRDEGCEAFPEKENASGNYGTKAANLTRKDGGENAVLPRRNNHPTVKPTALMRYLCRLVTPPGGIVLDPFTGSGSTGKAATLEGFRFIGIEREAEYVEIAKARIKAACVSVPPLFRGAV